jgi:hypothetical protein
MAVVLRLGLPRPGGPEGDKNMSGDPDVPLAAAHRFFPGLGKFFMSILALVVALAPVIALVVAPSVRQFVKQHPYYIYTALIFTVLIIVVLCYCIYFLLNKNRTLRQSERQMRASLPAASDREMAKRIIDAIPPESDLMRWLKLDFDAESLPASSVRDLMRVSENLGLRPFDFIDGVAHDNYEAYISALGQFAETVQKWTRVDARGEELNVPQPWDSDQRSQYQAATSAIQQARTRLIESYDALISTCHRFQTDA